MVFLLRFQKYSAFLFNLLSFLMYSSPTVLDVVVPDSVVKDEAMSRAVHGLEPELLFLYLEPEHVIGVEVPVTRGLPQLGVVHVWGHDLELKI